MKPQGELLGRIVIDRDIQVEGFNARKSEHERANTFRINFIASLRPVRPPFWTRVKIAWHFVFSRDLAQRSA